MKAKASVTMRDGTTATTMTTREALEDFFRRRALEIDTLVVDIGLTRWYWSLESGWFCRPMWHYVPNRPDQWQQRGKMKPATNPEGPFRKW